MPHSSCHPGTLVLVLSLTMSASANSAFYIDYQGLDTQIRPKQPTETLGIPDGYRRLTDKNEGLFYETGRPIDMVKIDWFASDLSFKDALTTLIPENFVVYIDELFTDLPDVSFDLSGATFKTVLLELAKEHGLKYVVDWDQQVIEISEDKYFTVPDFNKPVELTDENGRSVFIYTERAAPKTGFLYSNGNYVPVIVTPD